MSDLAAAAANVGGPEDLVMRSARARAAATGSTVDAILAAWAGGAAAPAATTTPTEAVPAATETAETEAATAPSAPASTPAPNADPAPVASPVDSAPTTRVVAAAPIPDTVTIEESYEWDQVTTVRTVGLKERTKSVIPIWMVGLFTLLPMFAVGYITVNSNGPDCGEAGQLAVDFKNELVNCDLTAYEGVGGGGGGQTDFIGNGATVYASCAACHGANGEGGAGPALSGGAVVATFSSCADQVTWVSLGSAGWQAEVGATYGDTNKPVVGGMQAWSQSLTEEEIRSVVLYERVAFGGEDLQTAIADCGLLAAGTPTDSTTPTETTTAP